MGGGEKDYFDLIFRYTMHKFIRFLPYVIIINILCFFVSHRFNFQIYDVYDVWNLILESCLLNEAFIGSTYQNGALWMLSAMFIIFPCFCGFCLIKNTGVQFLLSLYVPIIYYADINIAVAANFPYGLIRVLSGMMIGVFLYYLVKWFDRVTLSPILEKSFFPFAMISMVIAISLAYFQFSVRRIQLACFMVSLFLLFSNHCSNGKFQCNLTDYLGEISMIIYIVHYPVAVIINKLDLTNNVMGVFFMYYGMTIVISIILREVCKQFKKYSKSLICSFILNC